MLLTEHECKCIQAEGVQAVFYVQFPNADDDNYLNDDDFIILSRQSSIPSNETDT